MKLGNQNVVPIVALIALTAFAFVGNGAAAATPLNYPYGLAVAPNGNLYVANFGSNEILVYNPNYMQLTGKTITKNIAGPTAVVFDPNGNLWVANNTSNRINEYSPSGAQNVLHTITHGISGPSALAIDGISDLWVQNDFSSVSVYAGSGIFPLITKSFVAGVTGIATYEKLVVFGNNTSASTAYIANVLNSPNNDVFNFSTDSCFAMAFDLVGNLFCGNNNDTLSVYNFDSGNSAILANLPSFPTGLAVDAKRGRIYVALGTLNEILVYNTSGTLLFTIQ
jgi:DNA-binding beta-propeller fold protein YncE